MTPVDTVEEALHRVGKGVKRRGDNIEAQCPAHDDGRASLSVSPGTKGRDIVLHCHAGCSPDDIMAALGIDWRDFGEPQQQASGQVYVYTDATGKPLYRVHREHGKRFWQDHLNTHGEWVKGLADTPRVLYHLPEVIRAVDDGRSIWVCEGEKDVDRLRAEGVTATCNSGGAGKFLPSHADVLTGANVVVVADKDRPGYDHATAVRALLVDRHCTVRVVKAARGKDAFDHLAAGLPITAFETIDPANDDPEALEWSEPIPLDGTTTLPAFPVEALPRWVARMAAAVADELQVPVDLPAVFGLSIIAIAVARRIEVNVKSKWVEPAHFFAVVAMPPGAGKSPAVALMRRPLAEWELAKRSGMEDAVEVALQKIRIAEKAMKRAEEKGDNLEAQHYLDEKMNIVVPVLPTLAVGDITQEALGVLLQEQGGRAAIVSTEGGLFEMMTGRYSERSNLDIYLQAWSSDPIDAHRIGRQSVRVANPALTIALTVQPDVIVRLRNFPELSGRGLTARFMYAIPCDRVGFRNLRDIGDLPTDVEAEYHQAVKALLDHHYGASVVRLRFSVEAQVEFLNWRQSIEDRRRPGLDLHPMREWTTKLESTVVRVCGLLQAADGNNGEMIELGVVQRAIAIGTYWLDHAKHVHDMWGSDPVLDECRRLLEWTARNKVTRFSLRDAYRAQRRHYDRSDAMLPCLEILTERGWIRPRFDGPAKTGRGSVSPEWDVHPLASVDNSPDVAPVAPVSLRDEISSFSLSQSFPADSHTRHPVDTGDTGATSGPGVTTTESVEEDYF